MSFALAPYAKWIDFNNNSSIIQVYLTRDYFGWLWAFQSAMGYGGWIRTRTGRGNLFQRRVRLLASHPQL